MESSNIIKEESKPERYTAPIENLEEYINRLKKGMDLLFPVHKFKRGDIVVWEEGMQNKNVPDGDSVGIVVGYLNPTLRDEDFGVGSPYYNEVLDIEVGVMSLDNTFLVYQQDSKRFKLFEK